MTERWRAPADAALPTWAHVAIPDGLELRQGRVPILIVAPHGGRRCRPVRRGDSVNDLHTAGIAWELAERLDAHAIVNWGLDRNDIDLNRISHLATRAPDVLALLRRAVEALGSDVACPLVLFVHGWNMVVPCCDVGVGLRARNGEEPFGRFPTMSAAAFERVVGGISRALAARGISTGIGRRYSASGSDNAAQLFSGRHQTHESLDVTALAEMARAGRVDAAQLELGIPLRWEGPLRDALLEGLVEALAGEDGTLQRSHECEVPPRGWSRHVEPEPSASPGEPGYALQAVLDERGDIGMFCGVEATGPSSMAARFCIVCTDGSMMLLVGEGSWDGSLGSYALEGFAWRAGSDRIDLRVRGPLIRYASHDAYLDLESGLADSRLADADVALTYVASGDGYGRLRGHVRAGDVELEVDATAFLDRGGRGGGASGGRVRLLIGNAVPTRLQAEEGGEASLRIEPANAAAPLGRIVAAGECADAVSAGIIRARVPVWRPAGRGIVTRWTFGLASFEMAGSDAHTPGLFESLEVFRLPAPEA